jgi:GTPase SAR1 family protein
MLNGNPLHLTILDTGGGEDYDRLQPLCYPLTDAFVLCFSLVDRKSFANIKTKVGRLVFLREIITLADDYFLYS